MTQDARPSGASIRQLVFGEANVQRKAPGDPFLAPFFETAIERLWGGPRVDDAIRPVVAQFLKLADDMPHCRASVEAEHVCPKTLHI